MKNLAILILFLILSNTSNAQQRWSKILIGKPDSRALYASNVAKAIQNAWENEITSKEKKEMLLDEIIFGQASEKKVISEKKETITAVNNIDEIEEVLGIKEEVIDPVKKKKVETPPVTTPVKVTESSPTSVMGNVDEIKEVANNIDEKNASTNTNRDKKNTLKINLEEVEVDSVYDVPEVQAMYPGGMVALKNFFYTNVKTPESTSQPVKGKVFIRFMVKKSGELTKIYLVKGLTDACNKEALRVIKKMPNWVPARQDGENVNSWQTLPIHFEIE